MTQGANGIRGETTRYPVTMLVTFSIKKKCISAQLSCMPPFLRQINLKKFK